VNYPVQKTGDRENDAFLASQPFREDDLPATFRVGMLPACRSPIQKTGCRRAH
jgi:hypothetical protein